MWKTGIFPHMNFFFLLVIWNESTPGLASVLLFAIFSLSFYQIRKIYHYFIFCLAKGQFDPVWHLVCGSEGYWPWDWITIDAEVILISTKCAFDLFLPRQIHWMISCWSFHPKPVVLGEKLMAFILFSTQDQKYDFCPREIIYFIKKSSTKKNKNVWRSTVQRKRNFNDWVTFFFFSLDKHEHMLIFLLPSPLVCISGSKKDKKHYLGFNNPNTCPQQREKASEQLWQFHIACWGTRYLFLLFKLSYQHYKLVWNELAEVFIHQINIVPFLDTCKFVVQTDG